MVMPMSPRHRIRLARSQYKFSCAHMTVFPDGTKERLHGHNYFVGVSLELVDIALSSLLPFSEIKNTLAELCLEWKEVTLLAESNPHFEIVSDDDQGFEFRLCGKRYVLPREDVLLLPVDNISVEQLSAHFAHCLVTRLAPVLGGRARSIEVEISEVPGQGASTTLDI
jgi:6-pyruvoyltetrahydropterin/6-carboxytetrahydropterin synthase